MSFSSNLNFIWTKCLPIRLGALGTQMKLKLQLNYMLMNQGASEEVEWTDL